MCTRLNDRLCKVFVIRTMCYVECFLSYYTKLVVLYNDLRLHDYLVQHVVVEYILKNSKYDV